MVFLEWNMELLRAIARLRTPLLDLFNGAVTHLGEEVLFMAVALAVFWCVDKRRGYYLLMGCFSGLLVNQFLKLTFRVPRPWQLDPDFAIVESARAQAIGYSFPSGHVQNAGGLFGGFALTSKRRAVRVVCVVVIVLVALSRLYLGVHTPQDVVVSALVTAAVMVAFLPVYRAIGTRDGAVCAVWGALIVLSAALLGYVLSQRAAAQGLPADEFVNFENAVKHAYSMHGLAVGGLAIYLLDCKKLRFETKAVWWAQLLKLTLGMGVVLAVRAILKAPLYALLGEAGDAARYFVIVLTAGVWTASFRFFARLGAPKEA